MVCTLDKDGNSKEESQPLEFYANAVCDLISKLTKEEIENA